MGRLFTKNNDMQPWDGITERQRRLSAPLPNYPMKWLKLDQATAEGYHPFAGFFLPHEYPMMAGFLIDLQRAKREYCGVRDTKHAKGVSIFAKNLEPNGITDKTPTNRAEAYKTTESTKDAAADGVKKEAALERELRKREEAVASGEDGD